MNHKYKIVSLGRDCLVRKFLTGRGIKPTKENGELSYPFDLSVTPFKSVLHFFKNDFADYFKGLKFSKKHNHWINTKFDIIYNHDTDCGENDIDKFIKRFESRIENLRKVIASDAHIYFVISVDSNERKLKDLYEALKKMRAGKDFSLIVLDLNEKIKTKLKFLLPYYVFSKKHPYKNDWEWWMPENETSDAGIQYQRDIVGFVADKIEKKFNVIKYEHKTFGELETY